MADLDIEMLDAEIADAIADGEALDDYLAATEKLDQELDEELEKHSEPTKDTTAATLVDARLGDKGVSEEKSDAGLRPEALFLYGVDEMSTKDIEMYCSHLPLQKVEWINDSSCNLVFKDGQDAAEAALSLLVSDVDEPLTHTILRKAKVYTREDSNRTFEGLHIRQSTTADVKEKGARDRSRYYLLHGDGRGQPRRTQRHQSRVATGSIVDRLGPKPDIMSRLGKRDERRPARSTRPSQRQRRRSLSPISTRSPARREDDNGEIPIPDSLKGRIGARRSRS